MKYYIIMLCIFTTLKSMDDQDYFLKRLINNVIMPTWIAENGNKSFQELSPTNQETCLIGSIVSNKLDELQEYSGKVPQLIFSENAQEVALSALIDRYNSPETAPQVLDILIKHGTSVNQKGIPAPIHRLIFKACQTGNTRLLEAFLQHNADIYSGGNLSPYQIIWNHVEEQNSFKVLSAMIRIKGVMTPFSFMQDQKYHDHVAMLEKLDFDTLQTYFCQVIDPQFNPHNNDAVGEVVCYKERFEKQKLNPGAQRTVLELILEKHNSDLGCFFLNVSVKYGLDLNAVMHKDQQTGLEKIIAHTVATKKDILFKEAMKIVDEATGKKARQSLKTMQNL